MQKLFLEDLLWYVFWFVFLKLCYVMKINPNKMLATFIPTLHFHRVNAHFSVLVLKKRKVLLAAYDAKMLIIKLL